MFLFSCERAAANTILSYLLSVFISSFYHCTAYVKYRFSCILHALTEICWTIPKTNLMKASLSLTVSDKTFSSLLCCRNAKKLKAFWLNGWVERKTQREFPWRLREGKFERMDLFLVSLWQDENEIVILHDIAHSIQMPLYLHRVSMSHGGHGAKFSVRDLYSIC